MQRLRAIDRICGEFGCLPSAAVRELDEDPERLVLLIMDLRAYVAAKAAFDRAMDGKPDDLKAWQGSSLMTLVETHAFELRQARAARLAESEPDA